MKLLLLSLLAALASIGSGCPDTFEQTIVGSGNEVTYLFISNAVSVSALENRQIDCQAVEQSYKKDPAKFISSSASDAGQSIADYVVCKYPTQILGIKHDAVGSAAAALLSFEAGAFDFGSGSGAHQNLYAGQGHFQPETVDLTAVVELADKANFSLPALVTMPKKKFDPGSLGGCGVWATAIGNRQLGLTTPKGKPMTQAEYDDLWKTLGTFLGITPITYSAKYFGNQGYCSDYNRFLANAEEYADLNEYVSASGCNVQLTFGQDIHSELDPNDPDFLTDPGFHIETVIATCNDPEPAAGAVPDKTSCSYIMRQACLAADKTPGKKWTSPWWKENSPSKFLITNSWGKYGCIAGGTDKNFYHSRAPAYEDHWPPQKTDLFTGVVCKCGTEQPIVKDMKLFLKDEQAEE